MYNKEGQEIVSISYDDKGEVNFYTKQDIEKDEKKYTSYQDQEEIAAERLSFKPLLLPEKYDYQKAYIIADEEEKSDYCNFYYKDKNNREIILFERISTDENGYETGGSDLEEINIDGQDIIYHDKDSFEFEREGLLVTLLCRNMTYEEMEEVYKDIYLYK